VIAELRGAELFYELEGAGPPLFLLPGGPGGSHSIFTAHHGPLAAYFTLVYLDPRGCGQSSRDQPETFDMANYIADVEALREYLGYDRISLLGKSYGGMVARGYVLDHPDRVDRLILVATVPGHQFIEDALENLRTRGTTEQIAVGERVLAGEVHSDEEAAQMMAVLAPLYSIHPPASASTEASGDAPGLSFEPLRLGFTSFLREFDYLPRLGEISAPTMVIHGDHDWICDPKYGRQIAAAVPRAELVILPGSHAVDGDSTEAYLDAIVGFATTEV
jgi:proline iminopeptidase